MQRASLDFWENYYNSIIYLVINYVDGEVETGSQLKVAWFS